jgi:protein associated with RNAse G/E
MYAMNNYMLTKIPMDICVQLHKKMGIWRINLKLYISLVGSLIYVTNMWSNIHFVVSCVSKYMSEPEKNPFTSHQINSKILERHAWLWTTSCMFGLQHACKGNAIFF